MRLVAWQCSHFRSAIFGKSIGFCKSSAQKNAVERCDANILGVVLQNFL